MLSDQPPPVEFLHLKDISALYSSFAVNFLLYILRKPIELGPLLIVLLCTGVGVFLASCLYSVDERSLLYYGDSVSHLVRAREIVESLNPEPQQIGTVWLPLPHLLLLPFYRGCRCHFIQNVKGRLGNSMDSRSRRMFVFFKP